MPQSSSGGPAAFTAVAERPFAAGIVQNEPGVVTVTVSGELDLAARLRLERAVRQTLVARPWRLTIDLTGVTFCGAAGLQALLVLHEAAEEAGARMAVRPSAVVRRLLEITGLADAFPLVAPAPEGAATQRTDTSRRP
jgi:anti-sigma B factor antagonist